MYTQTSVGADLTVIACEREAICAPAAIQPHGVLFRVAHGTYRVAAVSANAGAYCKRNAADMLDAQLSDLIDDASFAALKTADLAPGRSFRLARFRLGNSKCAWRAIMHSDADGILLEAERLREDAEAETAGHFERFQNAILRLQTTGGIDAVCQRLAEEVQQLTGYHRVVVYRFAADCTGEVIAEASDGTLPSFRGLLFPAGDIPANARALCLRNAERQIPDVAYMPVKLLQRDDHAIDLAAAGLRSISSKHVGYLRNMGVGASMSISIVRNGALWGLVACHHRTARQVAPELRQSSVLLAQLAAARFDLIEEAESARHAVAVKAVEATLLYEATRGGESRDALLRNSGPLLDLLAASGLACSNGGTVTTLGATPQPVVLQELLVWLGSHVATGVLAIDNLAARYPDAPRLVGIAGLLAVPLGGGPRNLLIWFRPEAAQTVTWAGKPAKHTEIECGQVTIVPRLSFEPWPVERRGCCRPWTPLDISAANSLRDTIGEVVVRGSLDMVRLNAQLLRSNQELEAFSYVAAHDIKEPLRQIEIFGTLLQRAFSRRTDPPEKVERWFDGMLTSSRRLRGLIDDLANYARLGGEVLPFAPADLGVLLDGVLQDLEAVIAEAGGTVQADRLPVVMCDATQIRQVLQNLIANAFKFRHPDRPPLVRVRATLLPALDPARPADPPIVVIEVGDNGVGFDARHRERIFAPFERLHGIERYDGSGLGLAICRKAIERHGGTIAADGRPGEGAVFTMTLPMRPLPAREVAAP